MLGRMVRPAAVGICLVSCWNGLCAPAWAHLSKGRCPLQRGCPHPILPPRVCVRQRAFILPARLISLPRHPSWPLLLHPALQTRTHCTPATCCRTRWLCGRPKDTIAATSSASCARTVSGSKQSACSAPTMSTEHCVPARSAVGTRGLCFGCSALLRAARVWGCAPCQVRSRG